MFVLSRTSSPFAVTAAPAGPMAMIGLGLVTVLVADVRLFGETTDVEAFEFPRLTTIVSAIGGTTAVTDMAAKVALVVVPTVG